MRKMFRMLVVLFILYLCIQACFSFFSKGSIVSYSLKNNEYIFNISEEANFKENNNYFFKIESEFENYSFQVNHNFNKVSSVITDIKYFSDGNYKCILPIFRGNVVLTDMMCSNNGVIYYAGSLNNSKINEFLSSVSGYNIDSYNSNGSSSNILNIDVYTSNLLENHYIGITNYKGIYDISKNFNSTVYKLDAFKNDVYNQKLGVFVGRYYVVPNYDSSYSFNKFKVIDLVTLSTSDITSSYDISYECYVQGVVDNKVYYYDKENKVQLEVNAENKTVIRNNKENVMYYNNGEWSNMSVVDLNNEVTFIYNTVDYNNSKYTKIERVGVSTGYYYLYLKNGSNYSVYRINIQDNSGLTYLFDTTNIDNIEYIDEYIYFIKDDSLMIYNDLFGVKKVLIYKEFKFNKNISFNIYSK